MFIIASKHRKTVRATYLYSNSTYTTQLTYKKNKNSPSQLVGQTNHNSWKGKKRTIHTTSARPFHGGLVVWTPELVQHEGRPRRATDSGPHAQTLVWNGPTCKFQYSRLLVVLFTESLIKPPQEATTKPRNRVVDQPRLCLDLNLD